VDRTLGQLAQIISGKLVGDASLSIAGAKTISNAGPTDITFLRSAKFLSRLDGCAAGAAIIPEGVRVPCPAIEVADPEHAFAQVVGEFRQGVELSFRGISPGAYVADSAQIGQGVTIYPGAFVGEGVQIGDRVTIHPHCSIMDGSSIGCDTTIFPNVTLYEASQIGARVIIHSSAVIGGYGFGYTCRDNHHVLAPQLGRVIVEDDCEIGACSTIDRGTYDDTVIGRGTKIDNLVQIGHNCRIGKHNLIVSQVGIAGSSVTGDYVILAGQVGIGDHVQIGDRAVLLAQSGVHTDIPGNETWIGSPAAPAKTQMQIMAAQHKLPQIRRDIKQVKKILEALEQQASEAHPGPVNGSVACEDAARVSPDKPAVAPGPQNNAA